MLNCIYLYLKLLFSFPELPVKLVKFLFLNILTFLENLLIPFEGIFKYHNVDSFAIGYL